jgi:putative transposase
LASRSAFSGFLGQLRTVDWIVYAKRPFAGPTQVLDYLGRYTHRVALSNDRLVDHHDGRVRFRWKDYADHDRRKVMTLEVDEFLRRFLLHVVPPGFMRIRHFGLLANRTRRTMMARCRALLGQPPAEDASPESVVVLMRRLTGLDFASCPVCGEGRMQITAIVLRLAPTADTS